MDGFRAAVEGDREGVLAEETNHGFELLQKPYAFESLSRILRKVNDAPKRLERRKRN